MDAISVVLPPALRARLAAAARRRKVGQSALVREILARALDSGGEAESPNCLDLAGDLVGIVKSGREDLSTNRSLLEQAVLKDAYPDSNDHRR